MSAEDSIFKIILTPKYEWECDVFGNGHLFYSTTKNQTPGMLIRFWMRVFFKSKWKRIKK